MTKLRESLSEFTGTKLPAFERIHACMGVSEMASRLCKSMMDIFVDNNCRDLSYTLAARYLRKLWKGCPSFDSIHTRG